MVWKLLRKNISASQITGYALANLVGLAIVLCAIKFYGDVRPAWTSDDSFVSKDYLIISKRVSALNAAGMGGSTRFDAAEIDNLRAQPWVRDVGKFTAADFNVRASLEMGGQGMSSFMFFEAIPDNFLDIKPSDWHFDPAHPVIPIIMSKDYLALYNFGFAASRGLPQISESIISTVPMMITLSGNGHSETLPARIVGFSSRLNTIAVPQEFMDWANARYASEEAEPPSRLIVEANTPGDPAIKKYFDANGYEQAGDKADNATANYFLTLITGVVVVVGIVISLLAFFILMLSIYLLLQKNRQTLHNLMLLGYSPGQVARPYFLLIGIINAAVLILAIAAMFGASAYWTPRLASIGVTGGSPWSAIITGLIIMTIVTSINIAAITNITRRNFYDS